MRSFSTWWFGSGCGLAIVGLLSLSQFGWGDDPPATKSGSEAPRAIDDDPPPRVNLGVAAPSQAAPTAPATPEPQFGVPGALHDPAFSRYVDLQLLGQAYADGNPELLIDVAMQLQEGERILHRSHNGLKSADLLDIALRLAANNNDAESFDRLGRIAEKSGNKSLADKVKVSRELGSKSRAPVPPPPEPTEQLTVEHIAELEDMVQQLHRAQAVRDGAALQVLQARLKDSPLGKGAFRTYLETQLAEAQSALNESKGKEDPVVSLLGELSGSSRALSSIALSSFTFSDPNNLTVKRKGVYRNADAYRLDSIANLVSLTEFGGTQVPKLSLEALRARYGSVYVNSGSYMEIQVDANGFPLIVNGQTVRTKPGKNITIDAANPNQVIVYERRVTGGWWRSPDITFADAMKLNLEAADGSVGPAKWKATPIVAVTGEIQRPERTIALTAGSFKWSELNSMAGAVSFPLIIEAGGGCMVVPGSRILGQGINPAVYLRARNMPGGATIKNIVAAGGGNYTIQTIVAGGGGNLIGDGAGTIKSLIGQDGASFALTGSIKVPRVGSIQQIWSGANELAISRDNGAWLISKGGAGLIGQDGASISQLIGVGVGSIVIPRTGLSTWSNPYFRNATRLD